MHTPQDSSQFENTALPGESKLPAGLYIVGTPLGNLRDMSFRAVDTLQSVNLIACEDTRVTGFLTQHFGISTKRIAYHDHNAARVRPQIVAWIQAGQAVALVSDAGMPLVNDPGYKLVVALRALALPVTCIPGPTALVTGLALSGLPSDRFTFEGFLPEKQAARRGVLEALRGCGLTTIFYESPKRLEACLQDMAELLPHRRVAVARELTKKFEEVVCDTPVSLLARYGEQGFPRGEMVLIVEGALEGAVTQDVDAFLCPALDRLSLRDAAALVAQQLGLSKGDVYKRALALKDTHGT